MSKKNSNYTKKQTSVEAVKPEKKTNVTWIKALLVLFVFVLYGRTVNYEFTLDDDLFYLKHSSVQKGLGGFSEFFSYGSLNKFDGTEGIQPYRPITLLYFGIQKAPVQQTTASVKSKNPIPLYVRQVPAFHGILVPAP